MKARIISVPLNDGNSAKGDLGPRLAWMGGSKLNSNVGQIPVFGTQNVASSLNLPGGRENAYFWSVSGNLWVFGGDGIDVNGSGNALNDLWKFSGGKWTWVSGSKVKSQAGVYGTLGVPSTSNIPGARGAVWGYSSSGGEVLAARASGTTWVDGAGNLWLFGGRGYDSAGNYGFLNDLWKFDPSTLQWTWVSGTDIQNGWGSYGTQGIASAGNVPGARGGSASWVDANGKFWLFGGYGYDSGGSLGFLNDLWMFDPVSSQWTWVSGSNVINSSGTYGTQGVGSTSNTPGARMSALGAVDSSGDLWLFAGYRGFNTYNDLWMFDPSTSKWTWVSGSNSTSPGGVYGTQGVGSTSNQPGGRTAGAFWIDSHDVIWIFGGSVCASVCGSFNDLWKFDPSNGEWTWISGASSRYGQANYGTQGVAAAANLPGGRTGSAYWIDASDKLWVFGGSSHYVYGAGGSMGTYGGPRLNDLWSYDPLSGEWTWVSGSSVATVPGEYGTQNLANSSNWPGGRDGFTMWSDLSGHIWLFGGNAIDAQGVQSNANDLWKFDLSSGQWTWISGSKTLNVFGTYGTQGTGSVSNTPGSRTGSMGWTDSQGRLWLFGGNGFGSSTAGDLNDLWMLDPSSLKWTWIAGTGSQANVTGVYGTMGVGDTANLPGSRDSGATATDASGTFWLFGGSGTDSSSNWRKLDDLWKFDPVTLKWTWVSGSDTGNQAGVYGSQGVGSVSNVPGGRYQSSAWADSGGKIWIFGGWGYDSAGNQGLLNDLWNFDPSSGKWTWVAGSSTRNAAGVYGTLGQADSSNSPGAREAAVTWIDSDGNLWLFGGSGYDSTGKNGNLNDLWKFDTTLKQWIWISGSSVESQSGNFGNLGTPDTGNIPSARQGAAAVKDSNGNVWMFGGKGVDSEGYPGPLYDLWKIIP